MKPQRWHELHLMHATLCQALADPTRIAILYELDDGPKHVTELVEALQVPQATVSRHLKILRDRSMVHARREGAFIYYTLRAPEVLHALDIMQAVTRDVLGQPQPS